MARPVTLSDFGTFHESLNMASIWQAPLVMIITNNLYAEYSPLRDTAPIDDLAKRAEPHQIPAMIVDGQDIEAVYANTVTAVERARGGGGPTLIEMKTYRYRGHSRSDPAKYRPDGELERWKARDPITLLGSRLAQAGTLSAEAQASIAKDVQQEIDTAAARAAEAPYSTLEEIAPYVYAD